MVKSGSNTNTFTAPFHIFINSYRYSVSVGIQMTLSKLEQLVEAYGLEWDSFRDSLDELDREAFASLIHRAKIHAEAGSKIENPDLFESVVMSILVEHQREMQQLQEQLLPVDKKTCPRCSRTASLEDFLKEDRVTILCSHCQEALNYR